MPEQTQPESGFIIQPADSQNNQPDNTPAKAAPSDASDAGFVVSSPSPAASEPKSEKPENPYVLESGFEISGQKQPSPESELNRSERPLPLETSVQPSNPDDPWYKKMWDFLGSPLFDEKTAKNWFGWDVEHWNGWGRGLFDLASGLTSPLQIALTLGTFGGNALESAGVSALKTTMSAEEIAQVTSGSKILANAIKMGHDADTAYTVMPKFSIDPQVVANGLDTLAKVGMKPETLIANGIIRRTGSAMLRSSGVDIATADKVANWSQFMVDAGFTAQNAYGAVIAAPRVLDAIKEGDYETAKRLALDALGSGAFAALGGRAIHAHAGELMPETEAALGLRVKPSEENLKLIKLLEPLERERVVAGEREKQWSDAARKEFPEISPKNVAGVLKKDSDWIAGGADESDLRARFYRESENNLEAWHDAIAEAAGRESEQINSRPYSEDQTSLFPPDVQEWIDSGKLKDKPKEYVDQLLKASDPRLLTDQEKSYSKHVGDHFDDTGTRALGDEVLKGLNDSYATRVWKDPENDTIKKFRAVTSSPEFSVNSAMMRKRVFQSTLEGILKGSELADHDLISLAAFNGNELSRVAMDKEVLRRLRGSGARASDGRPMAALSGAGHVVESYDEQGNPVNPATFIQPKIMSSIRMADKIVEGLKNQILKPGERRSTPRFTDQEQKDFYNARFAEIRKDIREAGSPEEKADAQRRLEELKTIVAEKSGQPPRYDLQNMTPEVRHDFINKNINFSLQGENLDDARADLEKRIKLNLIPEFKGQDRQIVSYTDKDGNAKYGVKLVPKPAPEAPRRDFTQLDRLIKEGRVVQIGVDKRTGKPMYAWTVNDYLTVDHPAFKGWKMPTVDTEGNPIFVQGELKVHPEAHEYLQRRFSTDESLTKKIPGLKTGLAVAREAKGWLLAFSPFHFVQEGLRAIMTGISPIGNERFDPDNPMHVLAASKGVWEFKDYKGVRAFEDGLVGHSKIMTKIPLLREIQSYTQSLLFDRYIPGLKLRAFERMMGANEKLHPEWSKEQLANESADEVNERFGGLPYRRIGRSAATMDIARLTTLAPDWLESEMRFMKRIFSGEEGAVARRDVLKMTLGLWAAARVLNYLTSGQLHNEAPFGVAYKDEDGREKIYSIRTVPTDLLHAVSDPTGFLNGRLSPLLKSSIQTYTGRDEFGRKMSTNGIFVNLLRNVAPIGSQTLIKKATGEDTSGITNKDQIAKASGLTVQPYRTEAEKLAAKLASDHNESGPVDQDKLRRHKGLLELESRAREGKVSLSDVNNMVESGQLHVSEAKQFIKNVEATKGMDYELARLYSHSAKLPMAEFLRVWDSSTNEERDALSKLFIKKQEAYVKRVFKEKSQQERDSDPVYKRLRKAFPQTPVF